MKKEINFVIIALLFAVMVTRLFAGYTCFGAGSSATDENVLMVEMKTSDTVIMHSLTVLGSNVLRTSVCSITFLDSLSDMPTDAWDVSEAGDGTVMAWLLEEKNAEGMYNLYIAGQNGVNANPDSGSLFLGYENVREICFNDCFYTDHVTNMAQLFGYCSSLTEINLENFDTSEVVDMSYMFAGCSSLEKMDVTALSTSKVSNMTGMFHGCCSLEEIDVSSFDTKNVEDMSCMFAACNSLEELNLGGFDTQNVKDMWGMFMGCSSLKSLNLNSFDTTNVEDMGYMFSECLSLKILNLSNFKLESARTDGMFEGTDLKERLNQIWTTGQIEGIIVIVVVAAVAVGILIALVVRRKKHLANKSFKTAVDKYRRRN